MELWIRTNPKNGLVKVNEVYISSKRDGMFNLESKNFILGEYETKKRALEVLDEIQENLTKNRPYVLNYTNGDIVNVDGNIIYEMPEE